LIGGYSFGGTIAFEVAQNLTAHGEKISLLAILDSPFPTASRPPSSTDRDESFENPTKVSPRWLKIGVHFQRLAKLGFQAQVRYLHVRFKGRINAIGNKLRTNYKWLLCKASLTVGWRLPASVRSYYIVEVHKVARKAYKPRVFLGRAVYFKSTNRSSYDRDSWQNLMRDGMEVYEVPGDHLDLIKRENVSAWAGRLGSCITKAHAL